MTVLLLQMLVDGEVKSELRDLSHHKIRVSQKVNAIVALK